VSYHVLTLITSSPAFTDIHAQSTKHGKPLLAAWEGFIAPKLRLQARSECLRSLQQRFRFHFQPHDLNLIGKPLAQRLGSTIFLWADCSELGQRWSGR
jgi:hypothetical protein